MSNLLSVHANKVLSPVKKKYLIFLELFIRNNYEHHTAEQIKDYFMLWGKQLVEDTKNETVVEENK